MAKKALVIKASRPPKFKVRGYDRCKRCGRLRDMGSETRDVTPWTGRTPSPTGRMSGGFERDGRPD